jgi:hypothetical protein
LLMEGSQCFAYQFFIGKWAIYFSSIE